MSDTGSSTLNLVIDLEVLSKPTLDLDAQGFDGEEHISKPYEFRIYATTTNTIDVTTLINERAKLTVTTACGTQVTSGILFEVEERDPTPTGARVLVFTLVPRLAVTKLSAESRIFGPGDPKSVQDVIESKITGAPLTIPKETILDTYPKKNYIVQYNETDFTFISRTAEQAGIFYYFKQESAGDKVVFGDKNLAFSKVNFSSSSTTSSNISYALPNSGQARMVDEAAVLSFRMRGRAVTKTVKLRDYNETTPSLVNGEKAVGTTASYLGTTYGFGEHFPDDAAGLTLATVRADEIASGRLVFTAETDAPEMRSGHLFTLQGHSTSSLNGEYLVTSVTHAASRPAPIGFNALPTRGSPYRNVVQCIKSNVNFRPARVTPRPVALGVHTARVDGESWTGRAEIDSDGRYKLHMAFPSTTCADGQGSDHFRKIEPYLGPSETGLHFPLIAGTEVIVAYINGDIDRPIILGAVSNKNWKSVVTGSANTYNRLKSQSGAMFEIFDGPAGAKNRLVPF